ncbi:MAG: TonB-dependent receptor [Fusobacterium necrophorum]|nr:TonB-dependent receptor [Fusobacterium necrophorum]
MKKEMILTLLCFASLQAMAATQEVELKPTKIHGGGATFSGSVLSGERKNTVIITDKDIEKKQYKNITEIFEDSPLTIVTHTPAGPVVALRGSGEKTLMRVKVLVDGNSMTSIDESMGVIPFNSIPAGSIKRIEIIPGGGITLYGSGSSSGVINIVTKMGELKNYGSVSVSTGSFDTYKAEITKGIRINRYLFSNLSLEAKKGKGYRDREQDKRINALLGLNINFHPKHRMKIQGSHFQEDAEGTNELYLTELQKNRRGAGDSFSTIDSKRTALSIDYEYSPTENWTLTANVNQSKFTRDISQDSHPYLTFLPSIDLSFYGVPQGYTAEMVSVNTPMELKGNMEEKIKGARIKSEYRYAEQKGKFMFGAEHSEHSLHRDMNMEVKPFHPFNSMSFLIHKEDDKIFTEERLKDNPSLIDLKSAFLSLLLTPDTTPELNTEKWHAARDKFLYDKSTDEKKKAYDMAQNDMERLQALSDAWSENNGFMNYHFSKFKVKDFFDLKEKDGKKGIYYVFHESKQIEVIVNGKPKKKWITEKRPEFMEVDENTILKDIIAFANTPNADPDLRVNTLVQSKIDVKKKTDSFYLHNSYPLTEKLTVNAGLRYEKAKYHGNRKTQTIQRITGNADKKETQGAINLYISVSDVEYLKKDPRINWNANINAETQAKLKELKETGSTQIVMSQLFRKEKREEENLGGEIGFDYKINDSDLAYVKYERAFNSPLPNQLTNKTYDPIHKVKTYWESDLKTEKMDNFEIGIRGAWNEHITYGLAGFLSTTYDEIVSVVKDGNSHMSREWRFINLDKTRRMGIELQSEQVFDKWRLRQSLTYVDPKVLSNDYKKQVAKIAQEQSDAMIDSHEKIMRNNVYPIRLNIAAWKGKISEAEFQKLKPQIMALTDYGLEGKISQVEMNAQLEKLLEGLSNPAKKEIKETVKARFTDRDIYKERVEKQFREQYRTEGGSFIKKGDRVPLAPKIKATFGADYQFTNHLKMGTNVTYVGNYMTAEPSKGYEIVQVKVPSHLLTDFYGSYEFDSGFSVKFGINNVFNHKYYLRQDSRTATPAPGRTYSAGFSYRF